MKQKIKLRLSHSVNGWIYAETEKFYEVVKGTDRFHLYRFMFCIAIERQPAMKMELA